MSKINDIIEWTRENYCAVMYHDTGNLNVLADNIDNANFETDIFALILAPISGQLIVNDRSITESYTLVVSFVKPNDLDYDAEENECDNITLCRRMAFMWLSRLVKEFTNLKIGAVSSSREYLKFDAMLTGYTLTINVTELEPIAVC